MTSRRTAVFASPVDLADEGTATVLRHMSQRAGVGAITLAVAYHASRDLLPHNPARAVAAMESGVTYFQPDADRYRGTPLLPRAAELSGSRDMLAESIRAASQRGMDVNAWVVLLHNSRLASGHPTACVRNAFGDRLTHGLCPSQPQVQRYCTALVAEVAAREPAAVYLEAADFPGYRHGGHHERTMIRLDELTAALLGLCFCASCGAAAAGGGLDPAALRNEVRRYVRTSFAHDPGGAAAGPGSGTGPDPGRIPQLSEYLLVRQHTITRFVAALAAAIRAACPRTRVVLLDVSAAGGQPGRAALDHGRWNGLDLSGVAGAVDGVAFTAYADSAHRVTALAAAYREQAGDAELEGVLRPGWPDAQSPAGLRANVAALARHGVRDLGFYHYGLLRLEALDWISEALAGEPATR